MAKCYFTGKKTSFGHSRSFSFKLSNRTWKPNLQRRRLMINGRMQTVKVSVKALRALTKVSGK
ncbi:MAG: 50S ribosomal protein L28 [Anaerolineae bacterium]|nr:50S ribosomal protein L28 [Thermoflexales bacterium]MDW8396493.1 50S ribosomal protein L28 [Anaerolineae bacterium]